MSSLAQEESRSISENCTWGQRRRFEEGKVSVPFTRFRGYDKGEDGGLVVNPEQAEIVRRIYAEFLKGSSPYQIAKGLTADGIPTPGGKQKWGPKVVRSILTNEKYKGDALLQKVYTPDFLTKKKVKNCGQVPQYYVRGDHEAIIEPEIFDLAQQRMEQRSRHKKQVSTVSIFSSRLKCGCCGSYYGSKVWHSNDKYRKVIWQCNHKFQGEKCTTPTLSEDDIKAIFIRALNRLIAGKAEIINAYEEIGRMLVSTENLENELVSVRAEIQSTEQTIAQLIKENAVHALDQTEYEKRNAVLFKHCDSLYGKQSEISMKIIEKQKRRTVIEQFLAQLADLEAITDFDENCWTDMVDYVTVYSKENAVVTFIDGTEITA